MKDASRYTKADDGGIVDIFSIDPNDRYALGPYQCISCGQIMVPALGKTRKHHFKHKAGRPQLCTDETYLHQLGKQTLFKALSEAIETQKPFPLVRPQTIVCDHHKAALGITCTEQKRSFEDDLAKRFDQVELEKGVDGSIADILLSSKATDEKCFIEISVTHPSEEEKIASGHGIVEIELRTEDDLESLRSQIDTNASNIKCHNLPALAPIAQLCTFPCNVPCTFLSVHDSGKVWYSHTRSAKIGEKIADPRLVDWKVVQSPKSGYGRDQQRFLNDFKEFLLERTYLKDFDIRSCLLCIHNAGQATERDINCKANGRKMWMSTSATNCQSYLPPPSVGEARSLLDRNLKRLPE